KRHCMNLFGASERAVPIRATKGKAAVRDEIRCKAEITSHTHGRFDRVVSDDAGNYDCITVVIPQPSIQISPDKSTVRPLDDDRFTRDWRKLRLEFVSPLPGR